MASMIDFDMENKRLKAQIQELSDELKEKDNQIILSAQLGKELLESNSELNRQMEEIQDSNLMQIEVQQKLLCNVTCLWFFYSHVKQTRQTTIYM